MERLLIEDLRDEMTRADIPVSLIGQAGREWIVKLGRPTRAQARHAKAIALRYAETVEWRGPQMLALIEPWLNPQEDDNALAGASW